MQTNYNFPTIALDNDFSVDLSFLASLASPDFASENLKNFALDPSEYFGCETGSVGTYSTDSDGSIGSFSPILDPLMNTSPTYGINYSPCAEQHFFPEKCNQSNISTPDSTQWHQHLTNYLHADRFALENNQFQLRSVSKSSLKMKVCK